MRNLLLFFDALERLAIGFLVYKAARVGIALCPAVVMGVMCLTPVSHSPNSLVISVGFILCHFSPPTLSAFRFKKVYFYLLSNGQIVLEILLSMPILEVSPLKA